MYSRMPQPIITTQQFVDTKLIECRCNGARTTIEEGSNNSAWFCDYDDPVELKVGDQVSINLGIVNTSSAGQEVIEITDDNNTGLIKVCFYYGDCCPYYNETDTGNPQYFKEFTDFRRFQTINNPFNDPSDMYQDPFLVQGQPFSYKQFIMSNQGSPFCNFNYTNIFGGGSANIFPGNNNDLWYRYANNSGDIIQSQPFEAIHTITIPNGFYSPSNIADIINKSINKTYVKWFKYHDLVGQYSPPIGGQDNAFFTRGYGFTPMNIFTCVKVPDANLLGNQYNSTYPAGLNSIMNYFPDRYSIYSLPDINGIPYNVPNLPPLTGFQKNYAYASQQVNWWCPPEVLGGLFAQFNFNSTSGKFEFSNLHNPVRYTTNGYNNNVISTTQTNPIFKFATEDYSVNSGYVRTIQLAEGGCGIKLKGNLWTSLGFNVSNDNDWNRQLNWSSPDIDLDYLDWASKYNFTITDPFVSTQYGINNIGQLGDTNAFQYLMISEDASQGVANTGNRGDLEMYLPQINTQLADIVNQPGDAIPKPRGFRNFEWNSTTIQADNFADKIVGGYYLVQSDILGNDLTYVSESGKSLPICGILFKNYSNNDYFFSFNAITPFLVKTDRLVKRIYVRLLNPDFTTPTNLGTKSCIFFQVQSTFTQPYTTIPQKLSAYHNNTNEVKYKEKEG